MYQTNIPVEYDNPDVQLPIVVGATADTRVVAAATGAAVDARRATGNVVGAANDVVGAVQGVESTNDEGAAAADVSAIEDAVGAAADVDATKVFVSAAVEFCIAAEDVVNATDDIVGLKTPDDEVVDTVEVVVRVCIPPKDVVGSTGDFVVATEYGVSNTGCELEVVKTRFELEIAPAEAEEFHDTDQPPVNALSEVKTIDMTPVSEVTVPGRTDPVNGPAIVLYRPKSLNNVRVSYLLPMLSKSNLRFIDVAAGGAMVQ
jgi:hypothetical protein